jgi:hypothetical protein
MARGPLYHKFNLSSSYVLSWHHWLLDRHVAGGYFIAIGDCSNTITSSIWMIATLAYNLKEVLDLYARYVGRSYFWIYQGTQAVCLVQDGKVTKGPTSLVGYEVKCNQ